MITEGQVQTFGNLRLAADQIQEMQDQRTVLSVQRSEMKSLYLRYGVMARHPTMQMGFAAGMVIVSGAVVIAGIQAAANGVVSPWLLMPGIMTLLGAWVFVDAQRQGHYVEIVTARGTRKLAVGRSLSPKEAAKLDAALRNYLR